MKYIFGPVTSRRLGRSLGIDLFPTKICNFNCTYCEVGPSVVTYQHRKQYSPTKDIIQEITTAFEDPSFADTLDVCTITASGEPTLHSDFGEILTHLKKVSSKPVVVLTNSSTMVSPEVRQNLCQADIVVPSLDAATAEAFQQVDRPHASIQLEKIIEGLTLFSHQYAGKLWLEILFLKGVNDSPEELHALLQAIHPMRLDKIQLNTVFRPPASADAQPISSRRLNEIACFFKQELSTPIDLPAPSSQIEAPSVSGENGCAVSQQPESLDGILQMIKRRPCTAADISRTRNLSSSDTVKQLLDPLVHSGTIRAYTHQGNTFYQYVQ